MKIGQTLRNQVLIKLDPANDRIKLRNGCELYLDTSDEWKHATITGEVCSLPSHLTYTGEPNVGMPWKTEIEISIGDRVVFYYLSIVNALSKDMQKYFLKDGERFVFIPYDKIYAVYGEGFVKPINGYVLVEPVEDPFITEQKERMKAIGLEPIIFVKKSNTDVTFGKVKYIGKPIVEYVDENSTDEGVDIGIGDIVVLRKTYDIPLEYELHAKIDKASKLLRVQRRNLLAKL